MAGVITGRRVGGVLGALALSALGSWLASFLPVADRERGEPSLTAVFLTPVPVGVLFLMLLLGLIAHAVASKKSQDDCAARVALARKAADGDPAADLLLRRELEEEVARLKDQLAAGKNLRHSAFAPQRAVMRKTIFEVSRRMHEPICRDVDVVKAVLDTQGENVTEGRVKEAVAALRMAGVLETRGGELRLASDWTRRIAKLGVEVEGLDA